MLTEKPLCVIRLSNGSGMSSKKMSCQEAIEQILSGRWGTECWIQEVYLFDGYTYVLRDIATYSEDRGFQIIEVDEEFDTFVSNINEPPPESPALTTLKSFLEK